MRGRIAFALSICLLLTSGLSLAAQDRTGPQRQTLYVGPQRVFCSGALRIQKCYQVKDSPDAAYQNLFVPIEGFDYVPGLDYQIEVEVTPIENAPADTPRASYRLIDIVSQQRSLTSNVWILDSYQNARGDRVDALPDRDVTVQFDGQNVNGNGGCNAYGGSYTVNGDHIQIGPLMSTMMACADNAVMDQESAYHGLLSQPGSYSSSGSQLQLLDRSGKVLLSYHAQETLPLLGTAWTLNSITVGQDAVSSLLAGSQISASFDATGTVAGSAGCNQYSASYEAGLDTLSIGPALTTKMACARPDGVMDQELAFLNALQNVAFYQIGGDRLDLQDGDGVTLLSFQGQNDHRA